MIAVVVDDLAFVEADAIVRPSTSLLEPTQSALRRLDELGGAAFQVSLRDELPVGAAVVTGGGSLPSALVIHAIIRSHQEPVTADTVRRAVVSALHRAEAWEVGHLALPPIGTGAGHLGLEEAAKAMAQALSAVRTGVWPRQITIVVETEEERLVFARTLERLTA